MLCYGKVMILKNMVVLLLEERVFFILKIFEFLFLEIFLRIESIFNFFICC